MSERDLYLMFLPQIAELVVSCQQMDRENCEQWKQETKESVPYESASFMEKVFVITGRYSGHQISA